MGSIYKITNTVNGKAYIGQTIHDAEKTRIRQHLNGYSRGSELVKQAIEKYGKDAFTYEILHDGIIPEFLDMLEQEAIAKFNTLAPDGYNLTVGGNSGKTPSKETRRKNSEAHKGKKLSPEHCRKISESLRGEKNPNYGKPSPNRGKPRPEETCRKISESLRGKKNHWDGRKHTPETCRKMSEAHETPERLAARESFFSLPADMPLDEKRKRLRQRFPEKHRSTIHKWCQKFDSET